MELKIVEKIKDMIEALKIIKKKNNKGESIMKLTDLKTGMIAKLKNGKEMIVMLNSVLRFEDETETVCDYLLNLDSGLFSRLSNFHDDLTHKFMDDLSIVGVYFPSSIGIIINRKNSLNSYLTPIWERRIPKELTMNELEEILGYPVKIKK